jgi:DNA-binding transcriptional LysR family regulator
MCLGINQMDRLTAMQVFVAVVEGGSQSAAADGLNMSRPVVSRYLAVLEKWAGARLMHRTTRRLSLTATGLEVLPRCRQMLELADDLLAKITMPDSEPRGRLRITVSSSFGFAQMGAATAAYVQRYPGVVVDLLPGDRAFNLVDEGIDLAIRITDELDPNLIARQLSVCRSAVCASPSYLERHGTPLRAEELVGHNCLTHAYFGKSLWKFQRSDGACTVAVSGNITASDSLSLLSAALAGAGIASLPTFLAAPLIRRGELVSLLPDHQPQDLGIHAVYTSRKHMPATLRTMLDFLVECFGEDPPWDLAQP